MLPRDAPAETHVNVEIGSRPFSMKGSNSNRWFVLFLKNVVKLMNFHGDLLFVTSHSGGPLCGVPWKPS